MIRRMDLRQLGYLEAVLDLRTFSAAAEREHVSQPALWQQVRALEREWQVTLFERVGRRVRPTAAADALRPRIRAVLAGAVQLGGEVDAIRRGARPAPRYALAPYARNLLFLFEVIARYRSRHPEAAMPEGVALGTTRVADAIASGEVDIASMVPPPDWPFRQAPLYEVWLAAVGPAVSEATIDVRDLATVPLAVMTSSFGSRVLLDEAFRAAGAAPTIVLEHDSPEALVAAARSGLATAVLVSDALPLEMSLPVAEVRDPGRPFGGRLSLVWRSDDALLPAGRHLRDAALEYAAEIRGANERLGDPRGPRAGAPLRPPAVRDR
jgi:DNA-binding transcriptional LysR family regulator